MTKLTQATAVAMSTAASMVRTDWDHPGILHALRLEADRGTPAEDAFVALANLCANREARTPGLLNRPGAWWQKPTGRIERRGDHNVPCVDHPNRDMPCPDCKARDEADAITPEALARIKAAVLPEIAAGVARARPRLSVPSRVPTPGDAPRLDARRAQADREKP